MYIYGKTILRFSLGIIFIWFGYLKIIDASPAKEVVSATIFWIDAEVFFPILGIWEVLIGLFLCFKRTIRIAIGLLLFQMPGTFLPLIILPEVCFENFPLELSMEGQYIIKNLILISAAIVIGGTLREKKFIDEKLESADSQD